MNALRDNVLRTLLYYDIFNYPLKVSEIFTFFPTNSISEQDIKQALNEENIKDAVESFDNFFCIKGRGQHAIIRRRKMEQHARKMWRLARIMSHIIKRFPFVESVFATGSLSKNATDKNSDLDFFIITTPGRLWICRAFLTIFKKIVLLNQKKYFCINYYLSADRLEIEDKNIFTATEIAHIKPIYDSGRYWDFMQANGWIKSFFPNHGLTPANGTFRKRNQRRSLIQWLCELPFRNSLGDKLDDWLMRKMQAVWRKRYPHLSDEKRDLTFRVRRYSSKAHSNDFQTRILEIYRERLESFGLND
jgi:hypothetical protein